MYSEKENAIMLTEAFLRNAKKNLRVSEGCNFYVRYAEFLSGYTMNVIWNLEDQIYEEGFDKAGKTLSQYHPLRRIYEETPTYDQVQEYANTIMNLMDSYSIFANDDELSMLANEAYQRLREINFGSDKTYNMRQFECNLDYLMPLMKELRETYGQDLFNIVASSKTDRGIKNNLCLVSNLYGNLNARLEEACAKLGYQRWAKGYFITHGG